MNDDREVTCYALLTEHLAGKDVRDAARAAWLAQRDADDGCALLAATLFEARQFSAADVWRKARLAVDAEPPARGAPGGGRCSAPSQAQQRLGRAHRHAGCAT